ncbi:MAG: rhodanese-like domain-containing protein, partial [Rhodospirillales bacterium]
MTLKRVSDLIAEAETKIETLTVQQALMDKDSPDVELVDLRDIRELWREGAIPGAIHVPRGMLEFWIDPESEYHKE